MLNQPQGVAVYCFTATVWRRADAGIDGGRWLSAQRDGVRHPTRSC